jgi:hypothetical protein
MTNVYQAIIMLLLGAAAADPTPSLMIKLFFYWSD